MEEKEFVALVERLEVYSQENPAAYRMRVGLLAFVGYLFLFSILMIVALIVGAVIYAGTVNFLVIKILIIPLGLGAVVVRSLWIEFPKPEGVELKYSDAPRLFDLAKKIQAATQGPPVHKVLLTGDYNAGIIQRPRLGMLGWQEKLINELAANVSFPGYPYVIALEQAYKPLRKVFARIDRSQIYQG